MIDLAKRLEQMKLYRAIAIAENDSPLYIADLDLSIEMFEEAKGNQNKLHSGFQLDNFS